jgi:hypothetical protein
VLLAEYRRRYATIFDRADLYVPFFERGLSLLTIGGRLAFICANRWMKNRFGGPLRARIAADYHVEHAVDMEGTDAFQAPVMAYAAITVIRRGAAGVTRIARRPEVSRASLRRLVAAMLSDGPRSDPRVGEVATLTAGDAPWILDDSGPTRLLRRLEAEFSTLEGAGLRVGIGVASGADQLFVGDLAALPVEPARKLPLAMARDLVGGAIRWSGAGIINPFEADGRLAPLDRYPEFAAYITKHEARLRRRHVAKRNPRRWYRTIDRIYAELTTTAKLLIPDIKGEAEVAYDPGRYYPHHNLYYITAAQADASHGGEPWDLRALATVLRSSIAVLIVAAYCVKMSGGFLRFQAQYLRRVRTPPWSALTRAQQAALIAAAPHDRDAIDRAVFDIFRLSPSEASDAREAATAARVAKRRSRSI